MRLRVRDGQETDRDSYKTESLKGLYVEKNRNRKLDKTQRDSHTHSDTNFADQANVFKKQGGRG